MGYRRVQIAEKITCEMLTRELQLSKGMPDDAKVKRAFFQAIDGAMVCVVTSETFGTDRNGERMSPELVQADVDVVDAVVKAVRAGEPVAIGDPQAYEAEDAEDMASDSDEESA